MRRTLTILLALAAVAAIVAGCGKSTAAKGGLDDALGYLPKDSLVVVAIKTNLDDAQYKHLNAMLDRFPFSGQIKDKFKQGISRGSGGRFDFNKDVKPALGNDVVLGIPNGAAAQSEGRNFVIAWRTSSGDAKKLLSAGERKVGSAKGATVYQDATHGTFDAVKGSLVVSAPTKAALDGALAQRSAGNRLTKADFERNLAGLDKNALVRVEGDLQRILASSPKSAQARKVPWVGALRTFAATGAAVSDGIQFDFKATTQGALTAAKLPLAAGPASPPVVKRPGEIGTALRNPAQIAKFFEQAGLISDAKSAGKKARLQKQLGVNIDRDLIAQLGGDSASSFGLDGGFAVRSDLRDPRAFSKTLATVVKNLPKVKRPSGHPAPKIALSTGGLYVMTKPDGRKQYAGVVGDKFVLASDPVRAKEFAAQQASPVSGAHGAFVISADPRSIADAIIQKRATGAAALLGTAITGPLKDFSGWADSETGALTGHLKLTIR